MKKYVIKGNEPIYKNCRSTGKPNPNKQGYIKSYRYFGFEEYSFVLTKNLSEAKLFDEKEAKSALSLINFKLVNSEIIPVNFNVSL